MNSSKYVIRLNNGLYYSHMEKGRIMVVHNRADAHQFSSRMAAAQVCGLTSEFAGAAILGVNENQDAPPPHKDAL